MSSEICWQTLFSISINIWYNNSTEDGCLFLAEAGDRVRRLKIYIDTSVVGYLDQYDDPDLMADMHRLWEQIKDGIYSEIVYTLIEVDERTIEVAGRFIDLGVLREKSFDDCQHIAAAITSECDVIVSWNFKHIVNHKTIMGVKALFEVK